MRLEPAMEADIDSINEVILAAKRHWGYSEELIAMWLQDMLVDPMRMRTSQFWVMRTNQSIVGVVSLSGTDTPEAELDDLWVLPDQMGMGLGRKMMEFVVAYMRQSGITRLKIVAEPNAEGFYRKMGAVRIGWQPSIPPGRMLPVMVLEC
ncbi:GNAT family N-acetyltransferase [Parasalinivibrio latis]|uniref:GNAT family N-acetyltransferase n=1 Tax=Parasalinivibrio latis TaxID=2952610 RepID=UPI0030E049D9